MMIVGISNGRSYYFEIEPSFARMSLLTNLGEASNRFGVFFLQERGLHNAEKWSEKS